MIPTPRLLVLGLFVTACTGGDEPRPATDDALTDGETDTGTPPVLDCEDVDRDCAGVCAGSATVDTCGVCDDDPANDCRVTVTETGGWICPIGVSCQDVWEVELEAGASVSVDVGSVLGGSVIRLAVFRPGVGLDGDNVLVGTSRDLACSGRDEDTNASFVADEAGIWTLAVGRDAASSVGAGGSYLLTVGSTSSLGLTGPLGDDVPTEAPPEARCGSEYVVDGGWSCNISGSCQDTFAVDLPAGVALELSALGLTEDSVSRFALHAPGVALGGLNLLTNTANDRQCAGQNEDDVIVPYVVDAAGVYTVAITRDWDNSSGTFGDYQLVVAGDNFFDAPIAELDDTNSLAPNKQCAWQWATAGSWDCGAGETCQDVYDLALPAGARLSTDVSEVTGDSVVRLAAFAPGEPLSGTNLVTGANDDLLCGIRDSWASFEPLEAPQAGVYRIAVGRDGNHSDGTHGTYEALIMVENGYGVVSATVDDQASEAVGTVCIGE